MKPLVFFALLAAAALGLSTSVSAAAPAPPAPPTLPERGLKICVAPDAPAEVRAAAEDVLAAVKTHPLLTALAGEKPPTALTDSHALMAGPNADRAFNHLLMIGLPNDPLIQTVWQHEVRVRDDGGFYIFGFGHLAGDIGWIESDRNPFLHSHAVAKAPFETEIVTITGTNAKGVAIAVESFLRQGLINGVVARSGWSRPERNLLERDPLPQGFAAPDCLPERDGDWRRIGITESAEDEYRGVLADTGVEPREIWRAKYFRPGVWDGPGAKSAFDDYSAGLHRRATGNTLWAARFASSAEAQSAAPKIAGAAKLKKAGDEWKGNQPPYGNEKTPPGTMRLWQKGEWLFIRTAAKTE